MMVHGEGAARGEAPRFLCDAMVGRLARRLRMLGYDAAYERAGEDAALLARAAREGRVLLTRDTGIAAAPKGARVLLLRAHDTAGQLREVHATLGLREPPGFLCRCIECNVELRHAAREEVAARVPSHVVATQERFSSCPRCGRVFWPGTHRREMLLLLGELLPRDAGGGATRR